MLIVVAGQRGAHTLRVTRLYSTIARFERHSEPPGDLCSRADLTAWRLPYASAGAAGPKRLTDESFRSHVLEFLARPAIRSPESGVRSMQLTPRVSVSRTLDGQLSAEELISETSKEHV